MDKVTLAVLLILSCNFLHVSCHQSVVDNFVRDILKTYRSRSPTIIFDEAAPEICRTQNWVLCLSNGPDKEENELVEYFAMLTRPFVRTSDNRVLYNYNMDGFDHERWVAHPQHYGLNFTEPPVKRRHDILIFLGGVGQRELVKQIDKRPISKSPNDPDDTPNAFRLVDFVETPNIFTTDSPVFMPMEYADTIKLRLDTNVIFSEEEMPGNYKLIDMFQVKSGPPIALHLGKWVLGHGIRLEMNMYRWKRRTDLRGASMSNCYNPNGGGSAFPVLDDMGNIVGSEGFFPSMLYEITDELNLNVETTNKCELESGCNFTCWCNCTGAIKHAVERTIDVDASGIGITFSEYVLYDHSLAPLRWTVTLWAARQEGTAPNMWVYVNVFLWHQWAIFVALLFLVVMMISFSNKLEEPDSVRSFGDKKGSLHHYKLDSVMSGVALVGLYTIQMGSQTNGQLLGIKFLTMTASMLTFLMFVYYNTDITSRMTSGSTKIPVASFDDVVDQGYKVITNADPYKDMLMYAKAGSSKNKIYKKYIEPMLQYGSLNRRYTTDSAVEEVLSDSKTLLWSTDPNIAFDNNGSFYAEKYKLVDLKISDAATIYGTFALIKHSEFLQMLNYHLIMRYENGALHRHQNRWMYDANHQFYMLEPEPLGYDNVLFPFMCLGFASCISIFIAMMELSINRWNKYKRGPTILGAITITSGRNIMSDNPPLRSRDTLKDEKRVTYENKTYVP